MSILYETVFTKKTPFRKVLFKHEIFQVTHKEYPLGFPSELGEGTWTKQVDISWNDAVTKVSDATLHVSAILGVGNATPLTPVRGAVSFIVNGYVDGEEMTDICVIGGCSRAVGFDYPILGWLQKGTNEVKIIVRKSWGWPTFVTLSSLTCNIGVDFTGTPPEIKPTPPEWWGYIKWGMIGIGAIVGVSVVLPKVIEIARRPKG